MKTFTRISLSSLSMFMLTSLMASCSPAEEQALEVHTFTSDGSGFDTHSYWVDTGREVVVFDAQFTPALAEQMRAEIRSLTASPVRYVVVTHPNPDKFNGASVFQAEGATLVASSETAAAMPGVHAYKEAYFTGVGMFAEGTYPALPTVDMTFDGTLRLELDADVDITLHTLSGPGVSSTQTVALLQGAVIAGDLFANQVHAWLEGGIVEGAPHPTLESWQAMLDEVTLLSDAAAQVYPGRGEPAPLEEASAAQQLYLETMEGLVETYVNTLPDAAAALTGDQASTHYANITAEAEKAFPTYGLSYLVSYGVYGLALQKAGVLE